VTLPVYLNYLFNRLMAPRFAYRFMITEARRDFIAEHYPTILPHYNRIQIGAAQADLLRLLVLHKFGGVYWTLMPTRSGRSPAFSAPKQKNSITTRHGELSNYFIASASGNPNLTKLIEKVIQNIRENILNNVFHITGPRVFNELLDQNEVTTVFYRHACNQGSFTNVHFQYIDKAEGKWHRQQRNTAVIGPENKE